MNIYGFLNYYGLRKMLGIVFSYLRAIATCGQQPMERGRGGGGGGGKAIHHNTVCNFCPLLCIRVHASEYTLGVIYRFGRCAAYLIWHETIS